MINSKNAPLNNLNTFRIAATAKELIIIEQEDDLKNLVSSKRLNNEDVFILGGGSNVLFTSNFDGIILHSAIKDLSIVKENSDYVELKCGSGIEWDWLVNHCIENNWGGIENLSDIPGNVGASPVQNIGAYGAEAKDVITLVNGIDLDTGEAFQLNNEECRFGYRDSIFKSKPNYFVSSVHIRLSKAESGNYQFNINYGSLENELKKYPEINLASIRKAIIEIRQSKLPSVEKIGSAGSFFKNPVVEQAIFNSLIAIYPNIPNYPAPANKVKLSAAWLIDQSGLKGEQLGNVGTYPTQPLVIVNNGNAKGSEVVAMAEHIQKKVYAKFKIQLTPEVIYK